LQEAERLEKELNAALLNANDLLLTKAAQKLFLGEHREEPYSWKTIEGYKSSLANVIEVLGNFPLRLLDEKKVEHYINVKLRAGVHVQTRRDLAFLSSLYERARRWDCGVTYNPVRNVDKKDIREARKRKGNLEPHEFRKLFDACLQQSHKLFLVLGAFTGMRHQEIMKLHWSEVDLKHQVINLGAHRTKNRRPRQIPMHPAVVITLSNTPDTHRSGYVFKSKVNPEEDLPQDTFGKRFRAIRKRAGLPNVRIHDLRHTFASWMKQSGVPDSTTQELLGHLTASMTSRYSHDNLKSKRNAVVSLDLNTLSDTPAPDRQISDQEFNWEFKELVVPPAGFEPATP